MRFFKRTSDVNFNIHIPALPACLTLLLFLAILLLPSTSCSQNTGYPISFLNDRARDITGATAVGAAGFITPAGLTGEGQIVAIADSGLDAGRMDDIHPDLKSTPGKMPKVVLLKSWAGRELPDDPNGHGTHMAATIAGTGAASNGEFRGVAPGASIYFQAILDKNGELSPPANLNDLFWPAYSAGARIHVDGWGGGTDSYLVAAAQVDEFVRNHPDFLVIFGAGNSGPSPGTITAEANSKNALVVGASGLPRPALTPGAGDTSSSADFSSRGPTGDGRIKPELLAPASALISARSRLVDGNLTGYPAYTRMQGTSMAAAVAGGASTLLREYFMKQMNITAPSAALFKAVLVNGARTAVGGPSKDGFGVIDLAGTVIALKEGSFKLADQRTGVSHGGEVSYTYRVTDTTAPFKATVAWTDPPAEAGGTGFLVNDLDLIVKTPDGKMFYGNHFLGANSPDRTNNVEQVYLPAPAPGEYTIRVAGAGVRQNTVSGSSDVTQDFALVWGQAPDQGVVAKAGDHSLTLTDGRKFSQDEVRFVSLINGSVAVADAEHILPGAAFYRIPSAYSAGGTLPGEKSSREGTQSGPEESAGVVEPASEAGQRAYLVAVLWRAGGVRGIKTVEGTTFTEINPVVRLGGFSLVRDGKVLLNGVPVAPDKVPAGVEVAASINPYDQKARLVRADYTAREGIVSAVNTENGQKKVYLAGSGTAYRISPDAAYSYEDSYTSAETVDMPFGTGALEELEEIMPGMSVRLHLAKSSGEVQYLAVKRTVALGTVAETTAANSEVKMENGLAYRMFPGAPVIKDREISSFNSLKKGDHVTAVLLPDTGQSIGMVAFSKVLYGKVIDFSKKSRTLYLLDNGGRYLSYSLPQGAVIYRWGVRATVDSIATGCRVRVITDPKANEVWRLDIADTLFDKGNLTGYDGTKGTLTVDEAKQYRVSASTSFYKNGYRIAPEDLLQGEWVEIEYTTAPPPTGNVLISVNARTAVPPPLLLASVLPVQDRLVVTGGAGPNAAVYMWSKGGVKQVVPVDEAGRFRFILPQESETGYSFALVAVDRKTGGAVGRQVEVSGNVLNAGVGAIAAKAIAGAQAAANRETTPDVAAGYQPDLPLTRVEAAVALAKLFNWPGASDWSLAFGDAGDFPAKSRSAAAEAVARGIFKGYPDGSFLPTEIVSRAQAAVILSAVLRDTGLVIEAKEAPSYSDVEDIPYWAAQAVAETTSAGLFRGRPDGAFAPGNPVTAGEMAVLLERFLAACEREWGKSN